MWIPHEVKILNIDNSEIVACPLAKNSLVSSSSFNSLPVLTNDSWILSPSQHGFHLQCLQVAFSLSTSSSLSLVHSIFCHDMSTFSFCELIKFSSFNVMWTEWCGWSGVDGVIWTKWWCDGQGDVDEVKWLVWIHCVMENHSSFHVFLNGVSTFHFCIFLHLCPSIWIAHLHHCWFILCHMMTFIDSIEHVPDDDSNNDDNGTQTMMEIVTVPMIVKWCLATKNWKHSWQAICYGRNAWLRTKKINSKFEGKCVWKLCSFDVWVQCERH